MEQNNLRKFLHLYKNKYEVSTSKNKNVEQDSEERLECGLKEPRFKIRYFVIMLVFLSNMVPYYQDVTLSVTLVAMVNISALSQDQNSPSSNFCSLFDVELHNSFTQEIEGEFLWSPKVQGYLLGISFFCKIISMPLFAKLGEMYGGKRTLFWSLFSGSLLTFVSPFAAKWCVYALILIQGLRGMSQAGVMGIILVANWCPKQERGFALTFVWNGFNIGAALGSYFSGLLSETISLGGWKSAFFMSGAIAFTMSIMVWFFLYDNPSVHPKISQAEFQYITSNQENILTEKRPKTPWRKILTSVPVYALGLAYFGIIWSDSHFLSVNATYLKTILHYSVKQSAQLAALPFLLTAFSTILVGFLSKMLIDCNCMGIDTSRKFWNTISCFGYSACVLGVYYSGCNKSNIATFSLLAAALSGVADSGCFIASNDMSPTHSATIHALAFSVGNLGYIILPLTVGYLTDGAQTTEQWHKFFIISIAVVCISGLIFVTLGSAKLQPWNDAPEDNSVEMNEKVRY